MKIEWLVFAVAAIAIARAVWLEFKVNTLQRMVAKTLRAMDHNACIAESAKLENGFMVEWAEMAMSYEGVEIQLSEFVAKRWKEYYTENPDMGDSPMIKDIDTWMGEL